MVTTVAVGLRQNPPQVISVNRTITLIVVAIAALAHPADSTRRALRLVAVFIVAGFAALIIDLTVSHWITTHSVPRELHKMITLSEVFAHGTGVGMILVVVLVMDSENRRRVLRLGVASLGAGMASNVLKLVVCRWRPRVIEPDNVMATFGGWFPLLSAGSKAQSTPSSHTATAVGLALGLIWLYPRGRWLFVTLALLAACQRIVVRDHYVSDTCWGAAIGILVASACLGGSSLARWFNRFEQPGRNLEIASAANQAA